ncbi:hypothetical protein GGD50_005808 [Rhizobium paranaense]|uniref:Uncharacterized protein n=1 Tax=Rhizobium paranaense TaxID=1650438 RepID=A0A7W9D475_9HYPH|nr:hypothetical protein [Rhizobium paranaense]
MIRHHVAMGLAINIRPMAAVRNSIPIAEI